MHQVAVDRLQNIELHKPVPNPMPNHGCCATIFRVVTAVANFFRMIGLWLVEAASWLKDRVIDLFPEQTALRLDPRRIFVRTVLNVAPEQRAAVLQHALPGISPQMDRNTRDQLIQLVNNENPGSPLSRSMLRFITPDMYSSDSIETTAAIAAIPAEQRDSVIIYADQLITEELRRLSRRAIVEAVTAIPTQEREEVIRNALVLFTPQMDASGRANIIRAVTRVPVNQRDTVIAGSLSLITGRMSALERITITEGITAVPGEDRDMVISYANGLITEQMDAPSRRAIVEAVAAVPVQEREAVITGAYHFITDAMSGLSRKAVIEAVAAIPAQDQQAVMTFAHQLITDTMDGQSIKSVIEAIIAAPAEERETVTFYAGQLVVEGMDGRSRKSVVEAVTTIPAQQREAVVARARQLIDDAIDGRTRQIIIEAIIARADRLITQEMSAHATRTIYEAVVDIPIPEREEVVRNAMLLITPEMGISNRTGMIRAVARIVTNERDVTVLLALRAITQHMGYYSRIPIIEAVADIPAQERAEVMRNAVLLITLQMPFYDRIDMILTTTRVPVNERDAIIALALQAVTQDMGKHSRRTIIEAVVAVPAQERANVMQHALQLINPQMYLHDIVMIIRNVANVAADQRANYVQQRRQGQQAHVFQNAQVAAEHGVNVHEGNRDHRVRAAIKLLRQRQREISRDRINQAVQEFTQYLNGREMNAEDKQLAQLALLAPKGPNEIFGPLISENNFSILGLVISGEELIGRLWAFASKLAEPDQTNAKGGMISALKDSYLMGSRVCNQGKTQRLIVAVLQGRLAGVDIELIPEMQVSTPQAVQMFFTMKAHRDIEQLEPLVGAANLFCDENPAVNRADFVREIREYAQAQGFED
jgi:DNA-directed RNA polymerase specialized sigma24 family protein